ncbi:hypothetical protein PTTG_03807 [Puccinia triticina 1-1 BBBD Race 1]|uniref:Cell division cycle protein 123 n=1 Tax=Puccinia triticina (isolate 1-1 / race 1 (BBBD)) TaxID=630390 RepID=A0A180GPX3_PUCT1|nr:hypothetical protein PTTG_03807 [Puccinia triticina 1-1 BBBD Race 1]
MRGPSATQPRLLQPDQPQSIPQPRSPHGRSRSTAHNRSTSIDTDCSPSVFLPKLVSVTLSAFVPIDDHQSEPIVHRLPPRFLSWPPFTRRISPRLEVLLSVSPPHCVTPHLLAHLPRSYESQLSDSEDDTAEVSSPGSSSSRSSSPPPRYSFPELTRTISETIELYGGSVFPKLNWSAPQDAGFLLVSGDGPLRCRTPMDVYILLKGSDCVFHDLDLHDKIPQAPPEDPLPAVLVLREWFNLNPSHEFRCFVRGRKLIAISARSSTFYDFLLPQGVRKSILERIRAFFEAVICPEFHLSDFIFDVYLKNPTKLAPPSSTSKPNLKLVDINPFATYIDPCLFSYEELEQCCSNASGAAGEQKQSTQLHQTTPLLKLVESEDPHQNFRASKFQTSKLPAEFVNFSQDQGVDQLSDGFKKMLDAEKQ